MSELRGIDPVAVSAWLAEHLAGSTAPFTFELIAAGGSNLTYRVSDATGATYALRRPPGAVGLPTAHDMSREWRIMSGLANSVVPVPACLAYCDDVDITGAAFYVMEFVDGHIVRNQATTADLSAEAAEVATDSLVDVQVHMHTIDLQAVGLADLGRHEDYVGRQLKRWRGQVERADVRPLPLMVELHERLVAAKPPERAAPALAHGDYRFDNTVLGSDNRIAAVLDWELATTGDPLADFVWSLQYWADPGDEITWLPDAPTLNPVFARRDDVAKRYAAASGFDLSDMNYYTVFSWWKQACIVEGAYARRLKGQGGGMSAAGSDPAGAEAIADRVDMYFEHAHDLSAGVL